MRAMFYCAASFNQNIGSWDVSSTLSGAGDMAGDGNLDMMFAGATAMNQDLSGWCVTHLDDGTYFDVYIYSMMMDKFYIGTFDLTHNPNRCNFAP
jgi:hypothetical protein